MTDYAKFEKTVNVLLSLISLVDDVQFELCTDKKNQVDPISQSKKFARIEIKHRNDGSKSRPDAELCQVNEIAIQQKSKFH